MLCVPKAQNPHRLAAHLLTQEQGMFMTCLLLRNKKASTSHTRYGIKMINIFYGYTGIA